MSTVLAEQEGTGGSVLGGVDGFRGAVLALRRYKWVVIEGSNEAHTLGWCLRAGLALVYLV